MKASWIAPLSLVLLTACEQTSAPTSRSQPPAAIVYTPPPARIPGQKYVELPFPPLAPEAAVATAPEVAATAAATEAASEDLGPQLEVVYIPYPEPYPVEVPYYVESYYDPGYYSMPYGPFSYYPSYGGGFYYGYGGGFYFGNVGGNHPGHGGPGHGGDGMGGRGGRGGGGPNNPNNPHPEHPIAPPMRPNIPPAAPVTVAPLTPPRMAPHPAQMQMAMKAPRSGVVPPNPVYLQPGQAMNPTLPIYTTGAGSRPIQIAPRGTISGLPMSNGRGYAPPIAIPGQGAFQSAVPAGTFVPPQAALGTGSGRAPPSYINAAPPTYGGGPAMGQVGPAPSGGGGMIGGGPFYSSPPVGNMGGPIVPPMRTGR